MMYKSDEVEQIVSLIFPILTVSSSFITVTKNIRRLSIEEYIDDTQILPWKLRAKDEL